MIIFAWIGPMNCCLNRPKRHLREDLETFLVYASILFVFYQNGDFRRVLLKVQTALSRRLLLTDLGITTISCV